MKMMHYIGWFKVVSSISLDKPMTTPVITVDSEINKESNKPVEIDWQSVEPMKTNKVGETADINDLQIVSTHM